MKTGGANSGAALFLYDPTQSGDEAGFSIKALAGRQNKRPNQPPEDRKECAELRNQTELYPLQRPNGLATTHGTKLMITDKSYIFQ